MSETADALVIGGGLAGGAVAAELARAGRSVTLLEREAGPHHKVCGEFLSREALLYLSALGLDPLAFGAARIHAVRLLSGRRTVTVDLPFPALSVSRYVLDEALLALARRAGVDIRRAARAQSLEEGDGAWTTRLASGETLRGKAAFLATGKHDLRGWARPDGLQADLIGFKMHVRLSPAAAAAITGYVELTLFRGGYAGLEPVEGGVANLCLLVRRGRYAELGQTWDGLLAAIGRDCPIFAERMDGAEPCWDRPLAVSSVPYGYVRRRADGLWRLGDQAAVIPSFAGDGMSIALHSARLAADCFLKGAPADVYQQRLAADVGLSVRLATLLSMASVHPIGGALIGRGAVVLPGLMATVAAATRIPSGALRRAGLLPV
jgi:flavin-dependent dehydrogenase